MRSLSLDSDHPERGCRSLALRLVALGYSDIHRYRGGREAWEVAGLSEIEVDLPRMVGGPTLRRMAAMGRLQPFAGLPVSNRCGWTPDLGSL
jgi:hypothetical protein